MKYDILNRFTGEVQFTADIDATEDTPRSIKIGLAVKWGYKNGSNLRDSDLRGSDLRGSDLRDSDLRGSDLRGSDLRDSDLRGSDLRGSDLSGSDLRGSDLSDSDLRGSDWIPKIKNIHQSVYDAASKEGALKMSNWHTCKTTHCIAGWVCVLAGEGGKVLEGCYGTPAAAALIYMASDPELEKIPDFYADNKVGLEAMRILAEKEKLSAEKTT